MPDPIDLDALEALREAAGIYLPASVLGGMGSSLFFEMHSPARMGATAEYVEALVNAAPTFIAQARKNAEEIAALREELREARYVLWRSELLYRALRRYHHWLDAWHRRENSAWWWLAPLPITAGQAMRLLFRMLPIDDETTRAAFAKAHHMFDSAEQRHADYLANHKEATTDAD